MTKKQKKLLIRIIISAVLFCAVFVCEKLVDANRFIFLAAFLVPYFTAGWDVLIKCFRNITKGHVFDECFLMTAATVGALIIGEYPEAVFVMVFYQTGELFESIAVGRSRRSIASLLDIRPDTAVVERDGEEFTVSPEEVEEGELLVVRPGEKIPVDGIVEWGSSSLDTASLTGESEPADIAPGDKAVSGCINLTGTVKIRTTCLYENSSVAKILELVENSSFNKSKSEKFITRFARVYTPAVVIGAVLLAVIPSVITKNVSDWVYRALIFLVVSCPCALVISIPMSYFCAIGGAGRKGILIKGANSLEALAKAKTFAFDKTGTLTTGVFSVTRVIPAEGYDEKSLLSLAAAAEYYSNHPIASAIEEASPDVMPPASAQELPGLGIKAEINGKTVLAGNRRLMEQNGISAPAETEGTSVYIACGSRFAGVIICEDVPKTEASETLEDLKKAGVKKTVILTGDKASAAAAAAKKTGADEYYHSLLPEDKVKKIRELCDSSPAGETVVFVGDGINDAPVLTGSDIGIAMGALGSDAAIEAADMVIMDDNLTKLITAVKTARKTGVIVKENVILALGIKLGVLALAAAGLTSMWIGVFADVGVAVLAILNAMRSAK